MPLRIRKPLDVRGNLLRHEPGPLFLPVESPIDQQKINDVDRLMACGATTLAMILNALGRPTRAEDIEAQFRAWYGEAGVHGGVDVVYLERYLDLVGYMGKHTRIGAAQMPELAATHYLAIAAWCDAYLNPVKGGRYGHFFDSYDHTASGFACQNPWGGRNVTYADSLLLPATMCAIAIEANPAPSPPQQGVSLLLLGS